MKQALVFSMLAAAAVSAMAQAGPASDSQAMGRVVRTVPVVQQVPGSKGTPENRMVGYDVTYEYGGHRYTTRMASDPGSYVQVQGNVASAPVAQAQPQAQVQAQPQQSYSPPGVIEQGIVVGAGESYPEPVPVVYAPGYAPVYAPAYAPVYGAPYPYPYPYYGGYGGYGYGGIPIGLSLGFGFGRGFGGHGGHGGGRGHGR